MLGFAYNFSLSKKERQVTCKEMDFDWSMLHSTSFQAIFLHLYSWKRDDESWGDLSGSKLKRNHQRMQRTWCGELGAWIMW